MHPRANAPFDYLLWCSHCNHEWSVRVILRLSLELAPADSPPESST